MQLSEFDYYLPQELIAQEPIKKREQSRLLVLDKVTGEIKHKVFTDLLQYLRPGDVLVSNNTRVIPARLFGVKKETGAIIEVVLLNQIDQQHWEVLVRPGRRVKKGTEIVFKEGELVGKATDITPAGGRIMKFTYTGIFQEVLDKVGQIPLPHYIEKELRDPKRYQTVYAMHSGSAAAPTAGLHFTNEFIEAIKNQGVLWVEILLHVGLATFRPVKSEDITKHQMHKEYYEVTDEAAEIINTALKERRRVIAVGTTSTRALESAFCNGLVRKEKGWTEIFIYPGYSFRVISGMITNFHLPKSTLLMLVSALAGREKVLHAYQEAIQERYRFYSFGDAMLII